ncbi:MAG: hypothetical protein PUC97_05595, partial [bacterium]|nr:hypothetical protein [bacterium]
MDRFNFISLPQGVQVHGNNILFPVEQVEVSTCSRISQGQLAPVARPATLAEKALLRKRFCGFGVHAA